MPKKGAAAASRKNDAPSTSNDDGSYIVFGDEKSTKKKERRADNQPAQGVKTDESQGSRDAVKKPETRQLIGGASWTGKLPVNLLSEHCQKQKWAKPEYTMTKTSQGFSSGVILKAINPRTRETITLPPFRPPTAARDLASFPTALEARHFAATYTLFRVCSMRNVHMMLPPQYRDLWKTHFQDWKHEDVKEGRAWMYEADPFAAKLERDEAHALREKQREDRDKQKAKEAQQPISVVLNNAKDCAMSTNVVRGWTRVPKVEMGRQTRAKVEDLIRRKAVWNPHSVCLSQSEKDCVILDLTNLGFRRSHVAEAVEECKDRDETLDWLLTHVPEDDLPGWSLPEGYAPGVAMASGNLKREAAVGRLASAGYSVDLCGIALDHFNGNESRAAELLQSILLSPNLRQVIAKQDSQAAVQDFELERLNLGGQEGCDELEMVWSEEQATLQAIYGDRFTADDLTSCHIALEVVEAKNPFTLHLRKSLSYPSTPPTISVTSSKLPAYIRLSIIRQAVEFVRREMLGQPMIFDIVDWLEGSIMHIVENPGKLRNIAAGASPVADTTQVDMERPKHPRKILTSRQLNPQPACRESLALLKDWNDRQSTPRQQKMMLERQALPAWSLREEIIRAVNSHQVTIISGETGSGKSTQSVQFILDDMIERKLGAATNIICTQPRRISALGLADRVSEERCSRVGEEVGYVIRGESRQKAGSTKITFMTIGVLLRRLQASGGSSKDAVASLADVSHVVVDEVHERSLDTDFLLVLLRNVLKEREDLKVVLMSATLEAGLFEGYFGGPAKVGKVEIQGRTFPVEDFYLDDVIRSTGFNSIASSKSSSEQDWDDEEPSVSNAIQELGRQINYELIASTVQAIDAELGSQPGGVLIFLPGTLEINRTLDAIKRRPNMHALPLHASLTPAEQRRVFPPAPKGKRKVIAATNVAETSITIEDIVAVIDLGKVKETSFDPQNNMITLKEVWASRAACKQRRGRAGRVRAGTCYKLYTRNAEAKMVERPEPEIRRVPLEQLCLSIRAMGIEDAGAFLESALTPPEKLAVEGAIQLLHRIGALDGSRVTALGQHLSMIPADLRCGKLMVYGATFGCLEACLTIAAMLTVRNPFVSPQNKKEESKASRAAFAPDQGDLICDLRAFETWSALKEMASYAQARAWCDEHFLSAQTLNDISNTRTQYLSSITDAGFLPSSYPSVKDSPLNAHNTNNALLRALIAGAFNPQLSRIEFPDKKYAPSMSGAVELDPEARTIKFFNQDNGRVFIHPSSTLFSTQTFVSGSTYLSYFSKLATSKIFIRELTPFNVYTALLFSGPITLDTLGRGLIIDGWLRIRGWARIGVLVSRLRIMLDEALARKIEDPALDLSADEVVNVVRKLVEKDGLDQ